MIIKLADGRTVIQYRAQPLAKQHKVVLHLCDDDYDLLKDAAGNPRTLVKTDAELILLFKNAEIIGYIN